MYVCLPMYSKVVVSWHPSAQLSSMMRDDMYMAVRLLQSHWTVVVETGGLFYFYIHFRHTAVIQDHMYPKLFHR